jgi:hypothetical protein
MLVQFITLNIPHTLPIPCRYFDKTGTGYLRVEDLRRILHNLDQGLPHRAIKALVAAVADPHGAYRGERVYYRYVWEGARGGGSRCHDLAGSALSVGAGGSDIVLVCS